MEDRIADLYYISQYAEQIRQQLLRGEKPTIGYINRMVQLAQIVEREFDEQWQAWCDKLSCTE